MVKATPEPNITKSSSHHKPRTMASFSSSLPKLSTLLVTCATLFILLQIRSLHTRPSSLPSLPLMQWEKVANCTQDLELKSLAEKLQQEVTFLPLKDLRYGDKALQGHTWFMSSTYDTHEEGEVQYQQFPSKSSKGRLLCLKGRDTHDGSWNSYARAWPEALPFNATLLKGLTFVSYNHYNYDNIWHGLTALVPFVAWHMRNGCASPNRWILYHWGDLRLNMGPWLRALTEATFGKPPYIERFEWANNSEAEPACFENAVVMRHNEGGMSRERRMETFDLMRCRARVYCNVSFERSAAHKVHRWGLPVIGLTLFMRNGPRSFRNESKVIEIFRKECAKVDGCRLMVAHSDNLTFCDQVTLMSMTDILVSPHGAQLTNMFLMDRNSSVMEFFPKGWLRLAGSGQYVYHSIASWSGMMHQGAWRDSVGDHCPYQEDDRRCMSIYKGGKIGFNETYFSEWAAKVLTQVKTKKLLQMASTNSTAPSTSNCACT